MSTCKCEHWQVCPTCKPDMFDDNGNMLTSPPPPSKDSYQDDWFKAKADSCAKLRAKADELEQSK